MRGGLLQNGKNLYPVGGHKIFDGGRGEINIHTRKLEGG